MHFMKKRKIVVANWKMNPETPARAREIFRVVSRQAKKFNSVDVVVCPPVAFLSLFKKPPGKNLSLGVQDIFWEKSGPFTGETSPMMVSGLGASFTIVGHSERRTLGETDAVVAKKVLAALRSSLGAIVCIGERERDSGGAYFEFIKNQILSSLLGVPPRNLKQIIIAYEPLWAIGKSFKDAMKPAEVHEMAIFIRKVLTDTFGKATAISMPILYGGSVNFENAPLIIEEGNVDGLLVGRESLDPENFIKLLSTINEL